jgi:4-hydroxybenzoate polyprenyltransferase
VAIFALWALLVGLVAGVEWTIFTHKTPNYYLLVVLPVFAVVGAASLAGLSAARREVRRDGVSVVADLSLPSALIGVAVALFGLGREALYARRLGHAAADREADPQRTV